MSRSLPELINSAKVKLQSYTTNSQLHKFLFFFFFLQTSSAPSPSDSLSLILLPPFISRPSFTAVLDVCEVVVEPIFTEVAESMLTRAVSKELSQLQMLRFSIPLLASFRKRIAAAPQ